jgi:hypothetical protein
MTHDWKIYDLTRTLDKGVVNLITYGVESKHGEFSTRYIDDLGISGLASDPGFVEYENLTSDIVLGWVTGSVNVTYIEAANSASIASNISASAAQLSGSGLPW